MNNNEKFAAGLQRLNASAGESQLRSALTGASCAAPQDALRTALKAKAPRPAAPAPIQGRVATLDLNAKVSQEVSKQLVEKVAPEVRKAVREELTTNTLRQAARAEAQVSTNALRSQLVAAPVSDALRDALAPEVSSGLMESIVKEPKVIPVTVAQRTSLLQKKLGVFNGNSSSISASLGLPF